MKNVAKLYNRFCTPKTFDSGRYYGMRTKNYKFLADRVMHKFRLSIWNLIL